MREFWRKRQDAESPLRAWAKIAENIQLLMQERGLRNKDLEPALGSRGVTSEVISGKRKPGKAQIKKLAEFFGVAPEVFIALD